jgi:hypothetical protein
MLVKRGTMNSPPPLVFVIYNYNIQMNKHAYGKDYHICAKSQDRVICEFIDTLRGGIN